MSASIANPASRSRLRGFLVCSPLWIVTTFLFGGLGVFYVLYLKQDNFVATQAILVGDDATGKVATLGRFLSQAERKAAHETISELAKSSQVIRDTLIAVDRLKSGGGSHDFLSKERIEDFAKTRVSVHPPKGIEFGATQVIYIDVIAKEQDEAIALSQALCDVLESRLQMVRKARADEVIAELTRARDSARRELELSTSQLRKMQSQYLPERNESLATVASEGMDVELADLQEAREASISNGLLNRLDAPILSDRRVAWGRSMVAALGSILGIIFGLGMIFVATPIDESYRTLRQPSPVPASADRKPSISISSNSERDLAFQELSRQKSHPIEPTTQEQPIEMHVHDFSCLLPTTADEPMVARSRRQQEREEIPRQKPRLVRRSA